MKRKIFCYSAVFCILGMFSACTGNNTVYLESDTQEESEDVVSETSRCQPASCYVYICGAVEKPGVYELAADARVCDAIDAAGGFTPEAAAESLNQAEQVQDGQMIKVCSAEEAEAHGTECAPEADSSDTRVDLNRATKEQLMTIPGIGESKAESILTYREEHGRFEKTEDLMNIPGIKSGVYTKIKDAVKVN